MYYNRSWNNYHNTLRDFAKTTPTFYVTYEELMVNPTPLFIDMFCFMFGVTSIKGTILEQRIIEHT